jgi:hypothetical protein
MMSRQQLPPLGDPPEEEIRWAKDQILDRGSFTNYSTSFALKIDNRNPEDADRLIAAFGGHVSEFQRRWRWRIHGEALKQFLLRIQPLLKDTGDEKALSELITSSVAKIDARLRGGARKFGAEAVEAVAATPEAIKARKGNGRKRTLYETLKGSEEVECLPHVMQQKDRVEADTMLPPMPWNEDAAVYEGGAIPMFAVARDLPPGDSLLCKQTEDGAAAKAVELARAFGIRAHLVVDQWDRVFVRLRPATAPQEEEVQQQ